jgi:hypothetical protein
MKGVRMGGECYTDGRGEKCIENQNGKEWKNTTGDSHKFLKFLSLEKM